MIASCICLFPSFYLCPLFTYMLLIFVTLFQINCYFFLQSRFLNLCYFDKLLHLRKEPQFALYIKRGNENLLLKKLKMQFLGMKTQYCENDYTTKHSLQIQCDPYHITNGIFHRTRTKIVQFIWKHKRLQIAKAVLRKKNGAGGINFAYQIILQSYSYEDSMVLAQK